MKIFASNIIGLLKGCRANGNIRQKGMALCCILLFLCPRLSAVISPKDSITNVSDSSCIITNVSGKGTFIHQLGVELRPDGIFQTNAFLKGNTVLGQTHYFGISPHLRYSIQFKPHTLVDRVFEGAYQGVGLSYYNFGDSKYLGNPMVAYIFQGGRIANINSKLSFNYEWNLGFSWNWKYYDVNTNPNNTVIGSQCNAYINAAFYFKWMLSRQLDMTVGIDATHFSNGNTEIPNAGLNLIGLKLGVVYNFNRNDETDKHFVPVPMPTFRSHITYDLLLFGSWRRKGVDFADRKIASPYKYNVWGFNFAPMYNVCPRFRTGVSIDGVYDTSAGVTTDDSQIVPVGEEPRPIYINPSADKQFALGLSARAEFVMPFFAVNVGMGTNVWHGCHDLKSVYEVLALKAEVTPNLYLHIGYTLQNFHAPNYLMLGIGFRLNNRTAKLYR